MPTMADGVSVSLSTFNIQHLTLQATSRPSPVFLQNSVIAGLTVVNAALNIQTRLVLSLHSFYVRLLCSKFSILFLYFALSFLLFISNFFMYKDLTCWFRSLKFLTRLPRGLRRNMSEKLFLNIRFIPRLFLDCVTLQNPPPPYLFFPMRKCAAGLAGDQQLLVLKRIPWLHLTTGDHPCLLQPSLIFHYTYSRY
jgi:hypothetical protein